jgi:exopolysaccharide biosynthesis protein
MMKYLIMLVLIAGAGYAVYEHYFVIAPKVLSEYDQTTPTPRSGKTFDYKQVTRGYAYVNNISPQNLHLIPNFNEQLPASEIIKLNNCRAGINGGFYTADHKPIGLFSTKGEILSKIKDSSIFNGFINISRNEFQILEVSDKTSDYSLQTGPILIRNQQIQPLKLINDKLARRMVIGKNILNQVVILTVFDPETKQSGPFLAELPEIVSMISQKENLGLTEAVNLDGGRASAFYGTDQTLTETDPVGSWWCVR